MQGCEKIALLKMFTAIKFKTNSHERAFAFETTNCVGKHQKMFVVEILRHDSNLLCFVWLKYSCNVARVTTKPRIYIKQVTGEYNYDKFDYFKSNCLL